MAKNFFVLMRTLLLLDLCIHSDDGHAVLVIAYTFADGQGFLWSTWD